VFSGTKKFEFQFRVWWEIGVRVTRVCSALARAALAGLLLSGARVIPSVLPVSTPDRGVGDTVPFVLLA
jgi:hypothetical protein